MTFNELKEEIITLGFSEIPGSDAALAHHANRALERIYSDRGVRARARLYIRRTEPCLHYTDIERQRGTDISYTLGDGSLFLCVCEHRTRILIGYLRLPTFIICAWEMSGLNLKRHHNSILVSFGMSLSAG